MVYVTPMFVSATDAGKIVMKYMIKAYIIANHPGHINRHPPQSRGIRSEAFQRWLGIAEDRSTVAWIFPLGSNHANSCTLHTSIE